MSVQQATKILNDPDSWKDIDKWPTCLVLLHIACKVVHDQKTISYKQCCVGWCILQDGEWIRFCIPEYGQQMLDEW